MSDDVKELIESPMSDGDLRKILGKDLKIIRYSELAPLRSLEQLLPRPKDHCIILYEAQPGVGHWVALLKYNGAYEFFDPYGMYPDDELNWIPKARRKLLNQSEPYLLEAPEARGKAVGLQQEALPEDERRREHLRGPLRPPDLPPDPQRHGLAGLLRLHGPRAGGVRGGLRRDRGRVRGVIPVRLFSPPYI
jgi:hypothetical protein